MGGLICLLGFGIQLCATHRIGDGMHEAGSGKTCISSRLRRIHRTFTDPAEPARPQELQISSPETPTLICWIGVPIELGTAAKPLCQHTSLKKDGRKGGITGYFKRLAC